MMAFGPETAIVLLLSSIWFIAFITSPFLARRKGYAPYFWLFACQPLGLIVLACLPSTESAKTPEDLEVMQARANTTGAILTGIALFVAFTLILPLIVLGGPAS